MKKHFLLISILLCIYQLSFSQCKVVDDIYYNSSNSTKTEKKNEKVIKPVLKEDIEVKNDSISQSSKFVYCEIVGTGNLLGTKISRIEIDYGQEVSFWNQYNQRTLKDDSGKVVKFNSMVDALNYMGSLGWEFAQAYVVTNGNQNVYHFLLKRKIE